MSANPTGPLNVVSARAATAGDGLGGDNDHRPHGDHENRHDGHAGDQLNERVAAGAGLPY